MPVLSGRAPAKVNLSLRILERRRDGFHELRTVFQSISLADRLLVSYAQGGPARVQLRCDDRLLEGPRNLAARAARALLDAGSWKGEVRVTLEKRIPVGAGLGGGSSDAAAVLLALRHLLKPRPPDALLLQVAASLGSDIPYFLVGGTALGIGRGEEVYPLPDQPQRWLLLLAPDLQISTPEAYRQLSRHRAPLTQASRRNIINSFCSGISVSENREGESLAGTPLTSFENDFEAVVFRQHPALKTWKGKLLRSGASRAMLSGSGSALFGVFSDRRQAQEARAAFDPFPGKVSVARTMTRRSYRRLWQP